MASASDFNAAYYLSLYPDVAASGMDPLQHFQQFGIAENRAPNQAVYNAATGQGAAAYGSDAYNFNMNNGAGGLLQDYGSSYLHANPDVFAAVQSGQYASALDHYQKNGQAEGRNWFGSTTTALDPKTGAATFGGPGYADILKTADAVSGYTGTAATGGRPATAPAALTPTAPTGGLGGLGGMTPTTPAFDPTAMQNQYQQMMQQQSQSYAQMMQQMMQNQTSQMSEWQKSLGANFGKTYNPTGTGGSFSNTQSPVYRPGGQTDTGLAAANGFGGGWDNGPFRKTF